MKENNTGRADTNGQLRDPRETDRGVNESGPRFGERRSSTLGSKKNDDELFDDLARYNDSFEPQFFQSDIKRFETLSTNIPQTDGPKSASEFDPLVPYTRSYSRQSSRRKSITNTKSTLAALAMKKGSGKADKLLRKRKLCRFFSLMGCLAFIAAICIFLYSFGMRGETVDVSLVNKDFNFNLKNCRLFIEPCSQCTEKSILLDYRSSIKNIFYKILSKPKAFNYSDSAESFTFNVDHFDDILGCNLHMQVPNFLELKSLSIKCTENCILIQQQGEFKVASFVINGDDLSTNFAKVTVGDMDISANKGYVQINNLQFKAGSGSYRRRIFVATGDIILETSETLQVDYTTASENYCFSGGSISQDIAPVKTNTGPPLTDYLTQIHLQEGLFKFQWAGRSTICPSSGCSVGTTPLVELLNFDGNIFVNVLEFIPGYLSSSVSTQFGSRYGNKVDIPLSSQLLISSNIDQTREKNLPNLIIKFIFGNFDAWSVHGLKWVYTDHPIYSIIKPWWISFFTLSKLVENTNEIKTYLSPGICPYRHILTVKDNMLINQALSKYLDMDKGELHFLKPANQDLSQVTSIPNDGFMSFPHFAQFSDEWVGVELDPGENYRYKKVLLTENIDTFLIIVASAVISCLVAGKMTLILIGLLFKSFQNVREKLYHIEFYWKIYSKVASANRKDTIQISADEEEGEKIQANSLKNFNIKFSKSYFDLPSTTAFVDYLIMELWTSGDTSLKRFYHITFEEADYNKIIDLEMQNMQQDRVPLKNLKSLYQQMCFLMNYKESELSSTKSLKLLSTKGMVLTNSDSHRPYLLRFTMNTTTDLSLSFLKNDKKLNSLQNFLELFCEQTSFDEDRVAYDAFAERYNLFCKLNHMEPVMIDTLLLKNEFGIESRTYLKEMVERDKDQIYIRPTPSSSSLMQSIKYLFLVCMRKKTYYNLKFDRLKNVNLFLAGKLNESDIGKEEYKTIAKLAILEDYWWLNDFFAVFTELAIDMILSLPFMSIFIFQEIEHSSYSLRDESINIYGFNFNTNDIWLVPQKIMKNALLTCVFILFIFFWVSCIFNMIANIFKLEFPWIKVFDPYRSGTITASKVLNAYQWCFIIFSFWCILSYIILVVIWDIIASILNAQAYLATTSMAVAFIFMVYSLKRAFRRIWWESTVKFKSIFKEIWSSRIRVVVKKMVKYMSESNGVVIEQANEGGVVSTQVISHKDNIKIIELNLEKVIIENPKTSNFIYFFYSLIRRDNDLRIRLENMLLGSPFAFNKYLTQLLCNVLFMNKSIKLDRFNIEKNIKLVASVIFYYKPEFELVPITLKDLGDLKKCDCDPATLVPLSNTCPKCNHPAYQNETLKQYISNLRINDNAKIMVHMLDILSNLQRRRSDQVIKIVEKIFLESFSEPVFQPIKPTLDLIHFIVFNLVEDFDYVKLTQIFIDFIKRSLKLDMNLTEILMLYLLKDKLILSNEKEQVYDYLNTTSIYKRQICTSGVYSKEKKMLVKYLSLSTSFLAVEPQISDDLISDLVSDLNSQFKNIPQLSFASVSLIIHFPLYFTQGQASIAQKIQDHALNCNISSDISGLIYNFMMIANGTITWKKVFEHFLRKSPAFNAIKEKFEISFKELFGIIYMMKGDTHNEYFDRIITFILKKYNLSAMKKQVDILLTLYASSDKIKIKKALQMFSKYCTHDDSEKQFAALNRIFSHFKSHTSIDDEKLKMSFGEFFDMLPSKRPESDPKLKNMFTDCIYKKNLSKYRNFKENILFVNKTKAVDKAKNENELTSLLNIVELFYEINFGTDFHEMMIRFKEFVPEFEVNSLFTLCIKLLKTINGFKAQSKDVISEKLKESFNSLAEIMIGRPNDFENLWILIYSSDNTAKLSALNFFVEIKKLASGVDDERFKHHTIYIDKRVKFMKNQLKFVEQFSEHAKRPAYQFGITVIKRLFLKGFRITSHEIAQILANIMTKKNPAAKRVINIGRNDPNLLQDEEGEELNPGSPNNQQPGNNRQDKMMAPTQIVAKGVESNKLTLFYAALMDLTLNQDGNQLGAYFLTEHDEPMLKILALCRYSTSTNEIINRIFEQLIKNNHHKLCALLYFYYITIGMVQRRKINLKLTLEQVINDWVNIKPEFLEFIELYTDRKHSNMVDMVFKIQNRIFYNLYSDKELQKVTGILENLLTKEFYQNIDAIIRGDQPNITYLADLFKIPLKKMKFIYILTMLKLNLKFDVALEQFNNNQDIRKILEMQAINSQELVFLLKICLNEIDYDSITDLLRHMKLDQAIHPEVLINLLLLDLKVEKRPSNMKDFNKTLLVHSAIFERLKENKEICWAYCRVLKGDFLIYSELMDLLNEDFPQNNKYFVGIMKGMIGVKNYTHFDEKTEKGLAHHGVNHYFNIINSHFTRFRKGEQECSLEYAQYLLHNCQSGVRIHPFWKLMVDVFSDQNIAKKPVLDPTKFKRIPFLKDANIIHFIMIYNLVNADVSVIEFLHDFAFLRNIHRFVHTKKLEDRVNLEFAKKLPELRTFFDEKVNHYKQIMKGLIKDRKITFSFEHFSKKNSLIFQGFLMDVCKEDNLVQSSDFYTSFNKPIFQAWKQDLHRRCESPNATKEEKDKIDRLTKKIEDLFRVINLLVDPLTMFVTHENNTTKEYWQRVFEEIDNLDDYLDSVVNVFMKSLDEIVPNHFSKYKLSQNLDLEEVQSQQPVFGRYQDDDYDRSPDADDEISSTEEEMKETKQKLTRKLSSLEDLQRESVSISVEWFGLPVYILLDRLRQYQTLSSDDKMDKVDQITFQSNILFGILEKALYFYSVGVSFRKAKYFREFNLSIGVPKRTKHPVKYAGSLLMPELQIYLTQLTSKLGGSLNASKTQELELHLAKCMAIRDIMENDRIYFPNKGIFTPFVYRPPDEAQRSGDGDLPLVVLQPEESPPGMVDRVLMDEAVVNLGQPKFDSNVLAMRLKNKDKEKEEELRMNYYTLQFLARPEYKPLKSTARLQKIEEALSLCKQMVGDYEPTYISAILYYNRYYELDVKDTKAKDGKDKNSKGDKGEGIIVMYLPKFSLLAPSKDMKRSGGEEEGAKPVRSGEMKEANMKFLNDLALGKYYVLSETKNIFTEHIDLANHQKIYEAILHLHSAKRTTEWRRLITSLRILAPHLSSNVYNLNSVLEFVVEPSPVYYQTSNPYSECTDNGVKISNKDYYLFRELGLKNQSFFHIFLLQKYPNEIRVHYIQKIIEDLGIIDFGRIKQIIMYLLNLCYLVNSDHEASFTKEEFTILAEGILGVNDHGKEEKTKKDRVKGSPEGGKRRNSTKKIDEESKSETDRLIAFIYERIGSNENRRKNDKSIEKFHNLFETRAEQNNSKMSYDKGLIQLFNDFIMDITGKNKKSYLVKFENELKSIKNIFGVKNSNLMYVFDIITWVTTSHGKNLSSIDPNVRLFFSSKSFQELSKDGEFNMDATYSKLLNFISAFYKCDIEGILKFLQGEDMKEEYAFILSYYCFVAVLNGYYVQPKREYRDHRDTDTATDNIALCLCFPMIQQVYSSVGLPDTAQANDYTEKISQIHDKIVADICKINRGPLLENFSNDDINKRDKSTLGSKSDIFEANSTNNLGLLFKGELFRPFDNSIQKHFNGFLENVEDKNIIGAINRLKNLFFFKPQFFNDSDNQQTQGVVIQRPPIPPEKKDPQDNQTQSVSSLIKAAYSLRDTWEESKAFFASKGTEAMTNKNSALSSFITDSISNKCDFSFMNVTEKEKWFLGNYIFPTMIFVFIYLKHVRAHLDANDTNSGISVIKQSVTFIWKMFEKMTSEEGKMMYPNFVDPLHAIGLQEKETKTKFLNAYTCYLFNLKAHKSDISILKELLALVRKYVFDKSEKKADKKYFTDNFSSAGAMNQVGKAPKLQLTKADTVQLESRKVDAKEEEDYIVQNLVNSLKLDSFMELYDYLEELENGRDISESYKENIINLDIQIMNQYEKFRKHIPDIRNIVKIMQGDLSKIDYFVDKLFARSENANYTKGNLKNYINSYNKAKQSIQGVGGLGSDAGMREEGILAIPKEDRETLFKRADDGHSTASDIFLILRGRLIRNSAVSFSEIELIFKRLGINLTEHRFCEFLSATKLLHSKKSVGYSRINFSFVEENEFENLFDYFEDSVSSFAKESLKISPRSLMNFSLVTFVVFLVSILIASNLMIYFYGGDLFGALFCALIPLTSMVFISRVKVIQEIDQGGVKEEIEKSFEVITNSKSELIT